MIDHIIANGVALFQADTARSFSSIATQLLKENPDLTITHNALRKRLKSAAFRVIVENKGVNEDVKPKSEPKPFVLSAWNFDNGLMMDIEEYCIHYNLPKNDIIDYKLVSHTGTPYFNIKFSEKSLSKEVDYEAVKLILSTEIKRSFVPVLKESKNKEGVLKWADLHFGAHIRNLLLTSDYDSDYLRAGLYESVNEVNQRNFSKTHIHINGDLIESLSGLNHINSWMSMNKDEAGAQSIILCCQLLDDALRLVDNLGCVKIIGGNHDRLSKDNDEDVKGGAAELIAWGLKLKGYDVEFHPYIIVHKVEGVNHINLHGDKGISKKSTKDILWKYGEKGCFNFIFEAHLHCIIEKLSVNAREKFTLISDDGMDHRRMHLPSFFTGNYYSETLGFNSNSGYVIVDDNGRNKPNVFMGAI